MRLTRSVDLGEGRSVEVVELTVAEIRAWLAEPIEQTNVVDEWLLDDITLPEPIEQTNVVDEWLLDDITLPELRRMIGQGGEALDELAPSELDKIVKVAKEVNPRFFKLRTRLLEAARTPEPT